MTNMSTLSAAFAQIGDNILRCTWTDGSAPKRRYSLVTEQALQMAREQMTDFAVEQSAGCITLSHGGRELLRVADCALEPCEVIRYTTGDEPPQVVVNKTVDGERTSIRNLLPRKEREAYRGIVSLQLQEEDRVFGLGQDEAGVFDHRGQKIFLYQHNMRIPMPCIVSDGGWGIFFDCASLMVFDDTGAQTVITLDTVDEIEFYLIAGTVDEIIQAFRKLSGRAAMLPKWAFGYVQSRETYKTAQELVEVAQKYRDIGVPLDCIVQDWKTWQGALWGDKIADQQRFPDLGALNRSLHALHVHSMVSVWPNMAQGGANHAEFAEQNLLLGDYSTYDAFDERARDLYFDQLQRELYPNGFDALWCDSTEPFSGPDWCGETLLPEEQRYELVGGEHKKYLDAQAANLYAVMHAKGIYENLRKQRSDIRVLNLTRSGYPGIARYGAVLWAGDTSARWDVLHAEIAKGLNMSMSGNPYWTVDAGAFFTGSVACWRKWCGDEQANPVWFWNGDYDAGVADMGYRELYVRWLQFACFLPMFRSHGTDTPREIWNFGQRGEPFFDAIEQTIRLRYRLLPYIYSLAAQVVQEDATMMRALCFDFAQDETACGIGDQFMLGKALLVCPVTQPMEQQASRRCYLPAGAQWEDFYTGERYAGEAWVELPLSINEIPLFVRAGSILPLQKSVMHATENKTEYDVRIYDGADAVCVFYDDDGTTYDYEQGAFERIEFAWEDATRSLRLRETNRLRDGALRLHVQCGAQQQTVLFDGGALTLTF